MAHVYVFLHFTLSSSYVYTFIWSQDQIRRSYIVLFVAVKFERIASNRYIWPRIIGAGFWLNLFILKIEFWWWRRNNKATPKIVVSERDREIEGWRERETTTQNSKCVASMTGCYLIKHTHIYVYCIYMIIIYCWRAFSITWQRIQYDI